MDRFGRAFTAFVIAGMVLSVGIIAYTLADVDDDVTSQYLSRFRSANELKEYLQDAAAQRDYGSWMPMSPSMGSSPELAMDRVSGPDSSYSRTNVQVEGVDEADEIKTDGEYLYISTWNDVRIVRAYPPDELSNVSTINETVLLGDQADGYDLSISGIFVNADRLVVIGGVWKEYDWSVYYDALVRSDSSYVDAVLEVWEPSRAMVFVLDISDVYSPMLERSVGITGYGTTSRMIGDHVYLVAQSSPWIWDDEMFLPEVWNGFESEEIDVRYVYYDPETRDPNGLLDVIALNVTSGDFGYISIVAGYASTVYMSQSALYLSIQKWSGQITFDEAGNMVVDSSSTRTTIYKVGVDGLTIDVKARGEVKGWLLNQFSLDESGEYLRVATTSDWYDLKNAVYVLDSDLDLVGSLESIAPGETIFSARFVGDTLYLVTFRQIDPLFVIDLSDPAAPKILGELEMPGFSSYLHPVDEDHVLGIGQENGSVKISLYDVSEPTDPVEKSKILLGQYSHTSASYDHKAVLFDLERELLVIPVQSYWWSENYSMSGSWSGFYVFGVSTEDGISVRGTIECMNWTFWMGYDYSYTYYDYGRRALYIEDYLYTVSSYAVTASLLSDLSEVNTLLYREPFSDIYYLTAE
jgi:uncharacterized secreted protein with C-terminal beta-propeller domain